MSISIFFTVLHDYYLGPTFVSRGFGPVGLSVAILFLMGLWVYGTVCLFGRRA